jgi:hypothetical protein
MTELVNLTSHPVSVFDQETASALRRARSVYEFYELLRARPPLLQLPARGLARVDVERVLVDLLRFEGGVVPIYRATFARVVHDLPPPAPDTRYIVSAIAMRACPYRTDLLVPVEGVRDPAGRIVGCAGFDVRED